MVDPGRGVAETATVIVPETVDPEVGLVIETVGPGLEKVTDLVAVPVPAVEMADIVRVWAALVKSVVSTVHEGLVTVWLGAIAVPSTASVTDCSAEVPGLIVAETDIDVPDWTEEAAGVLNVIEGTAAAVIVTLAVVDPRYSRPPPCKT
jgi:hypothetical protein